jgi:hypothetical protein
MELFDLACKEPDQDKVGALFEEILCLLDVKQRSLTAPLPTSNRTPQ